MEEKLEQKEKELNEIRQQVRQDLEHNHLQCHKTILLQLHEAECDLQAKNKQISLLEASLEAKQAQLSPVPVKKESNDEATQFVYSDFPAECKPDILHAKTLSHICDYLFAGDLIGAEIYGEIIFEVNASSLSKYTWREHGFQLLVPEGALPFGVTATVSVRAIVGGSFELPKGSKLIGGFYWISSTHPFQKKVIVRLQHCAL